MPNVKVFGNLAHGMGLRWAVSLKASDSFPHFESLFRRSLQCIPFDDVTKHARFHYRDDSLACIIGRIMIRSAAVHVLSVPWQSIEIGKSSRGKPRLLSHNGNFEFNVSHQGDMVVLASSRKREIGVDVMRVNEPRDATATQHISRMAKLFTTEELEMMNREPTEEKKWTSFYRVWCLKEAVLKATGTGLVNDLRTIGFHVKQEKEHVPGCFLTSTTWSEKGVSQRNWLFEESFVDEHHSVAVGRIYSSEEKALLAGRRVSENPKFFELKSLSELLENSSPVNQLEDETCDFYEKYMEKPWKDRV